MLEKVFVKVALSRKFSLLVFNVHTKSSFVYLEYFLVLKWKCIFDAPDMVMLGLTFSPQRWLSIMR